MGELVERERTPVTSMQAATALLRLAPEFFPQLTQEGARLMLAQLWLETSRGKDVFNNSPGNIMAAFFRKGREVFVWDGDYYRPPWYSDDSHPTRKLMLEGKEPSAFRSFEEIDEGMRDYLTVAKKRLAPYIAKPDADSFAEGIRESGYCPACPASWGKSLRSIAAEFEKAGYFSSLPHFAGSTGGLVGGALVLGVTGLIFVGTLRAIK